MGIAKDLLLGGADPLDRGSQGAFPIHLAAHRGQDGVLLFLVRKGIDLDCLNAEGKTPLRIAAHEAHISTVKILLAGGADVNLRTDSRTILQATANHNKAGAIPALVEAGANLEARDNRGLTPLWYSAFHGACAAMLSLSEMGADVHTKSDLDTTPLHVACHKGEVDAANLLLKWGADETAVSSLGRAPSSWILDAAGATEEDRPRLERLSKLLANAPRERAWRRRGCMVMCRAYPNKLHRDGGIQQTAVEAVGGCLGRPPSRRARVRQVKIEVGLGDGHSSGANGAENRNTRREGGDGRAGSGSGFNGVTAWFVVLADEDVSRKVVGFL